MQVWVFFLSSNLRKCRQNHLSGKHNFSGNLQLHFLQESFSSFLALFFSSTSNRNTKGCLKLNTLGFLVHTIASVVMGKQPSSERSSLIYANSHASIAPRLSQNDSDKLHWQTHIYSSTTKLET